MGERGVRHAVPRLPSRPLGRVGHVVRVWLPYDYPGAVGGAVDAALDADGAGAAGAGGGDAGDGRGGLQGVVATAPQVAPAAAAVFGLVLFVAARPAAVVVVVFVVVVLVLGMFIVYDLITTTIARQSHCRA